MVSINYSAREVCCKIVYYGPGLSGKTTNLQYVHSKIPSNTRGKLISLATEADRTLYFDFLPINIGTINGFQAKFQLYTVPGQVYYNATRKLVLRGVDGLVFVADSQPDKMDENIESWANLIDNLHEYGYDPEHLPIVIQYNKRDLPGVLPVEEMQARLNQRDLPHFEASATVGNGVFDTLKLIIKLVLEKAKSSNAARISPGAVTESESTAEEQAVAAGNATTAQEPAAVGAAPGAAMANDAYRPYPGSQTGGIPQVKASPVKPSRSQVSADQSETPITPAGDDVPSSSDTLSKSEQADAGIASDGPQGQAPRMAPSLRRRDSGRKRGFFKRLLGIK